jgi:hypothetical protein
MLSTIDKTAKSLEGKRSGNEVGFLSQASIWLSIFAASAILAFQPCFS